MPLGIVKRASLWIAAATFAVSCSALERQGLENSAGTSFIQLIASVESYLDEASYPEIQDPDDLSQWSKFFDVGDTLLEDVENSYLDWSAEIANLRSQGLIPAQDVTAISDLEDAFDDWLEDAGDQASLSRSCMLEDINPLRCYSELIEKYSDKWEASQQEFGIALDNWMYPTPSTTAKPKTTTPSTPTIITNTVPPSPRYTIPSIPRYTATTSPRYTVPPTPSYTIPTTPIYTIPTITAPATRRIGAVCRDGWRSRATGSGACSWHGGVSRWLYSN